jgi:spore coat polysaccharide biosynthesis predicted glycosyltransferase SpsG
MHFIGGSLRSRSQLFFGKRTKSNSTKNKHLNILIYSGGTDVKQLHKHGEQLHKVLNKMYPYFHFGQFF